MSLCGTVHSQYLQAGSWTDSPVGLQSYSIVRCYIQSKEKHNCHGVHPDLMSSTPLFAQPVGLQIVNSGGSSSYILWHTCRGCGWERLAGARAEEEVASVSICSAAHSHDGVAHTHTHTYTTSVQSFYRTLSLSCTTVKFNLDEMFFFFLFLFV